jgi:hypothetical protein
VNGWYAPLLTILKALGLLALAGTVAAWRTAFVNRLIGAEPRQEEVS